MCYERRDWTHPAWAAVSCDSASANHSTRASTRSSLLRRGVEMIQACTNSATVLGEAGLVPGTAQCGARPLTAAIMCWRHYDRIAPVLHLDTPYAQRGSPSACSQAHAAPPAMQVQQTALTDAMSKQQLLCCSMPEQVRSIGHLMIAAKLCNNFALCLSLVWGLISPHIWRIRVSESEVAVKLYSSAPPDRFWGDLGQS